MVQITRRQLCNPFCKRDGWRMRCLEKRVVVRQLQHLPLNRINNLGAAIPNIHAPQPRHPVKDFVAVRIPKINPLCPRDHPRSIGIESLGVGKRMQVVSGILLLQNISGRKIGDIVHGAFLPKETCPAIRAGEANNPVLCGHKQTRVNLCIKRGTTGFPKGLRENTSPNLITEINLPASDKGTHTNMNCTQSIAYRTIAKSCYVNTCSLGLTKPICQSGQPEHQTRQSFRPRPEEFACQHVPL